MQFFTQGNNTFTITPEMIQIDHETMQTLLQNFKEMNIVLAQILMEALYVLQVSFMQEVQLRVFTDATKLEVSRGVMKMMKIMCDQLTTEKEEQKDRVDRLEQGVTTAYEKIPNSAQIVEPTTTQNIDHIVETIDEYR
jgi:hypothetical protein